MLNWFELSYRLNNLDLLLDCKIFDVRCSLCDLNLGGLYFINWIDNWLRLRLDNFEFGCFWLGNDVLCFRFFFCFIEGVGLHHWIDSLGSWGICSNSVWFLNLLFFRLILQLMLGRFNSWVLRADYRDNGTYLSLWHGTGLTRRPWTLVKRFGCQICFKLAFRRSLALKDFSRKLMLVLVIMFLWQLLYMAAASNT